MTFLLTAVSAAARAFVPSHIKRHFGGEGACAIAGKKSPSKEPRATAADQARRDKGLLFPAVSMIFARGIGDSMRGISYRFSLTEKPPR